MVEYNWLSNTLSSIGKFVESFGYSEIRVNNMYPYTFEQTIKVTHYNKPKRRDAARSWKNKA